MSRYEVRSREIYDIVDTEIDEVVTSAPDREEATEVAARLERRPIDSAADPVLPEVVIQHQGFAQVEDDEPVDVGGSNVT